MRISDWSSDVCSSDLLADRAHAAVAEIVDIVDLALAVLQVHERLDDREDILGAQRRHRILGVEIEAHVQFDAAHRRQIVAVGRSEEHTSELQSLMRISYAVFCLKKKNIRNDKKTYSV